MVVSGVFVRVFYRVFMVVSDGFVGVFYWVFMVVSGDLVGYFAGSSWQSVGYFTGSVRQLVGVLWVILQPTKPPRIWSSRWSVGFCGAFYRVLWQSVGVLWDISKVESFEGSYIGWAVRV